MEPSVKGAVVRTAVEQIRELLEQGRASEADLRAALGPAWSELALAGEIGPSTWYPAPFYDALLRFMMATAGAGRPEFVIESGRQAAAALTEKGIYGQMQRKADGRYDESFVRTLITLSKSIYSFTTWELGHLDAAAGFFEIVISDAAEYPDTFMWRNVGFVETMTCHATGERWRVRADRPARDRIVLTVRRFEAGA